jgi:hypothetical protein
MNHSDSITKISQALTKAWANIGAATKDAKNPFFKSSYATLGEVMEVVKQPLLDQGIIVLQPVVDGEFVETVLLHESGEWISGKMKLVCAKPNDPQAMGSAVSYNRRYGLQSFCFVPSVDDDAEKAMGRHEPSRCRPDPNAELQAANKTTDW